MSDHVWLPEGLYLLVQFNFGADRGKQDIFWEPVRKRRHSRIRSEAISRALRPWSRLRLGSWFDVPSGKLTFCYGKSLVLMGKSTISMAIFNSYVSLPEGIEKLIENELTKSTFLSFSHDGSMVLVYILIKGVYWWDPWHTIYSSTMDPSWVWFFDFSLKLGRSSSRFPTRFFHRQKGGSGCCELPLMPVACEQVQWWDPLLHVLQHAEGEPPGGPREYGVNRVGHFFQLHGGFKPWILILLQLVHWKRCNHLILRVLSIFRRTRFVFFQPYPTVLRCIPRLKSSRLIAVLPGVGKCPMTWEYWTSPKIVAI